MARAKQFPRTDTPKPAAGAECFLEIGVEELPYQFVAPALRTLAESSERLFKERRLPHGTVKTVGTPRRLVLVVHQLAASQTPAEKEAMGPSKAVAFDMAGQPTKAALGFAASQGVAVTDLEVRTTPKGEYVFAVKREPGRRTAMLLPGLLSELISGLSFPKSMKWNASGVRFARPIRWLAALYGGKVVPMQWGEIKAGNRTWGHRFLGKAPAIPIKNSKSYFQSLERHGVIADHARRLGMINEQLKKHAKAVRGIVCEDKELLEQAVFTVEYPHVILGSFNQHYLSLPKEVIMAVMKEHQGYFSLVQRSGELLPQFITVTNMKLSRMDLIRKGNERVLSARLADAKFYFDADLKIPLAEQAKKLTSVVFHQKLGTLAMKHERIKKHLVSWRKWLAIPADDLQVCLRAGSLCKADLLTGVVGEFPSLQGIMGGEYARHGGEPEAVCRAITEHCLPLSMESELPATTAGKMLSLVDRIDTIVGFFRVGVIPTGSEDPFALRRHALAVVRILTEGNFHLNLSKAVHQAWNDIESDLQLQPQKDGEREAAPFNFIAERFRHYCRTNFDFRDDVIEALAVRSELRPYDLGDLLNRMKALAVITNRAEFDPLIIGFKRAHRLIEKEQWEPRRMDVNLFQHPSEHDLYKALVESRTDVPGLLAAGNYRDALNALVGMKSPIDRFFENVMVNAENPALRANRLSLLYEVDQLFLAFADFSQIVVQGV